LRSKSMANVERHVRAIQELIASNTSTIIIK
jgi:hypothetical protein